MSFRKISFPMLIVIEIIVLLMVVILSVISFFSGRTSRKVVVESNNSQIESETELTNDVNSIIDTNKEEIIVFSDDIEAKIVSMTNEQKAAQLFLTSPEQITGVEKVSKAGDVTRNALLKYPVGGLIYSEKNFISEDQVRSLLIGTQDMSREIIGVSLILGIQEEGGSGNSPLAKVLGYETIADTDTLAKQPDDSVYGASVIRGKYLTNIGFNMVIDYTATNLMERMQLAVRGSTDANISYAAGVLPSVSGTEEEYSYYADAIEEGLDSILTESNLDNKSVASFRENTKYEGIFIGRTGDSDCVTMVQNGCDMIISDDFINDYQKVLEGIENGDISSERIHNALGRILYMKSQN